MRALAAAVCVVSFFATAAVSRAQAPTQVVQTAPTVTAPLERRISVPIADVSLREALERVAVAARVRFSYASEALPLERSVRTTADTVTLAALLAELLSGVGVTPVAIGPNQIVLAESHTSLTSLRISSRNASHADERMLPPTELSRVIVTGTPSGGIPRPLTVSLSTIDREQIARLGATSLTDILDAGAPGVWIWESAATSGLAHYGSIRGASSLGTTYPKIYIDGISVANPLLLTTLDPDGIDRIEIIRGPQGAALYGSDAISGVINIVSRRENPAGALSHVRVRSIAGVSNSAYASAGLAQNHFVSIAGGTAYRSGQIGIGLSTLGDYYQNAASRHVALHGAFHEMRSRVEITGTARLSSSSNGLPVTVVPESGSRSVSASGGGRDPGVLPFGDTTSARPDLSLTSYTVGVNVRAVTKPNWTNTLVVGVDGYRMRNFANELTPFPSTTDSALRAARGGADRTTARATSSIKLGESRATAATLSLVLEQSALRQEAPVIHFGAVPRVPVSGDDANVNVDWLTDYGASAQADLAFHDKLYITGGLRVERNEGYVTEARTSLLPMIGATYVQDLKHATLKWRAAFGTGMRAPRTAARETMMGGMGGMRGDLESRELAPERQSGIEAGFDLFVGRAFALQVTGFNQLASGLIQQVVVPDSSQTAQGWQEDRLSLSYQNVGAISNRGVEVEAMARRGHLQLKTAFAAVSSTVRSVAQNYTGDLRVGDRALGVPSRTVSASLSWTSAKWNATLGVARAYDWTEYDRLALAEAYTYFDRRSVPLYGADLRGYWRQYEGNTRLRASLSRTFGRSVTALVTGENLLGGQRGEPDNATIVPGRTISAGWRFLLF